MKLATVGVAAALLALPTLLSAYSTPPPGKAGPPVVPYLCSEGRPATVVYENGSGSRHAKALVTYEGRTIELEQGPTLYGVRYRTVAETAGQPAMAWSLRGEEAWLTESPDVSSYTRDERAIARCIRLRGMMPEAGHGGDDAHHGTGEHDDGHDASGAGHGHDSTEPHEPGSHEEPH